MLGMKAKTLQSPIYIMKGRWHGKSHAGSSRLSIAALSGESDQPIGMAACSFEIDLAQPWQQILPGQDFSAYDGRPHEVPGNKWRINDETGPLLAAKLNARPQKTKKLLVDYEHQTLLAKESGREAPASAWGEQFEWRNGEGLFAKLSFTPKAQELVKNNEYAFYSPVVIYDKKTGDVVDLHSAALTNDPAIQGMDEAAALSHQLPKPQPEDMPMNPALLVLLKLAGLDKNVDATKELDAAALHALLISPEAKTAIAALQAKLDAGEEQTTQIAALTAQVAEAGSTSVNLAQYVPIETYNGLITEMAALTANHESVTVDQVIQKAKDEGRYVIEAETNYLKDMGNSQGIAALTAVLNARPVVDALKGDKQTKDKPSDKDDKPAVAALSADQKLLADQLGISHEAFAKDLNADK